METHYHPHHHPGKKFTEYLMDFLMIFLAVTLGFFSENIKENLGERQREKEYMKSFIKNLKTDIAELKELLADTETLRGYDSLFTVNKEKYLEVPVQDSIFYYSVRYLSTIKDFKQTDFTIIQLRNAGGYRLIEKSSVADSIAKYEEKNDNIKMQSSLLVQSFTSQFSLFDQLFDLSKVNTIFSNQGYAPYFTSPVPVLITKDYHLMALYINQCYQTSLIYRGYRGMLQNHETYLQQLIAFLGKEYNLGI